MKALLLFVSINFILFFLFQTTEAQTNQTVTNGSATAPVIFPGAGCVYNWVNDTPGIGLAASGKGNIASFTAVNTSAAPVTAIITGLPVNMGPACNGTLITFSITVKPSTSDTIQFSTSAGTISACAGAASASPNIQLFIVSGSGLTDNITATAPAGFEVSLSSTSGYGSNVTLIQAGDSVSSTVVYVRSAASAPAGNISGNVVLSSPGATSQNVAVTGTVNALQTVNSVPNQTVNNAAATTAINFTGTATAFSWVNDTPGIGLAASGTGNIPSFTAVNTGNSPVTATITASPLNSTFVYAADLGNGKILVINTATNTLVDTINTMGDLGGLTVSPDGSKLYRTDGLDQEIQVINTATNNVIGTIPVPSGSGVTAISPDGVKFYICNSNASTLYVVDAVTKALTASIKVGASPTGVVVSPDGGMVYVANEGDGSVSVISTANNTVVATVAAVAASTSGVSNAIGISPDGRFLYVGNSNNQAVYVINTATNAVAGTIPIPGSSPFGMVISPDGSRVYVTNYAGNNIAVINTVNNTIVSNIILGARPEGMLMSRDGSLLYVINGSPRQVSVVNTATNVVLANVMVDGDTELLAGLVTGGSGCSGAPIKFTITVNPVNALPAVITAGAATGTITSCAGTASEIPNIQQFTVSGTGLTSNITATAPTGFEVSLSSASGYGSSVILTQAADSVSNTVIYVRSAASAPAGSISGNVVLSSTGATSQNVAVTGTVNALLTVNPVSNQTVNNGTATTAINFTGTGNTFTWVNDNPGIGLAASGTGNIPSFTAVNTSTSPIKATVTVTPSTSVFAYIANAGDNTVSVINTATKKITGVIPVGSSPQGVSVSPDGGRVYVTNQQSNNVSVINTATKLVIATIPVGMGPMGICASPDGSKVYVANYYDTTVSVISTASNGVIGNIVIGSGPDAITVSPDGGKLYVTGNRDSMTLDSVYVVNTATGALLSAVPVGQNPNGIAVSPDGSRIYVTNTFSNNITVINTATNAVVTTIPDSTGPWGVCVSADGSKVYISNSGDDTGPLAPGAIAVVNAATNTVITTIPVGTYPVGISITPDGGSLYVANIFGNSVPNSGQVGNGTVSVISTATNAVNTTLTVGNSPISEGNFITPGAVCGGVPVTFTITVNPTLITADTVQASIATGTITACAGAPSASPNIAQFTVSGNGLKGNITATAPTGFEVSLVPAGGYGSNVTLTETGDSLKSTIIYVRSSASAVPGSISGNVILTSTGAVSQSVAVKAVINVSVTPSVIINASANNICSGTPITFTALATNGGSTPSYQWMVNNVDVQNIPSNSNIYTDSSPADGEVISCRLTSGATCAVPDTASSNIITLKVNPTPAVNAGGPKTIKAGSSISLNASATGSIADITWSPVTGLSNYKILNPVASPSATTTYTLLVQTTDGCVGTDTATIGVFVDITIPNTFTPNGDGINDTWNIKYLNSYPNCTVGVYNRYGEKLYSSIGYGEPWDGTYKGTILPKGTYYYIIDLKNGLKVLSGNVTIIR